RQVVRAAVHAPHSASHFGIEHDPVGSVPPLLGNPVCRGCPRGSAILAAKKSDIRIGDEPTVGVEGIEVNAITGGNVQANGCPAGGINLARVQSLPCCATVGGAHG